MALSAEYVKLTEQVPILGIVLILCLLGGKVAKKLNIPKVTTFLLIGVLLGPSAFNILTTEITQSLNLFTEVALGLILFNIGGEFHKELLKEMGSRQVKYSFALAILNFTLISSLCFISAVLLGMTYQESLVISFFLGVIAIEAAPPTSLLVMKEYKTSGNLSLAVTVYLAIGTGFAIIGSRFLKVLYSILGLWTTSELSVPVEILLFIWSILGAVLFGVLLGFALSLFERRETKEEEILLAVACTILFGQSLSYYLKTDPLIISLVLGLTLVNASDTGEKIHATIKDMGLSLYAIFFVLAGSHIHFQTQLKSMGFIGLAYILSRTFGILIGSKITGSIFKTNTVIQNKIGLSLLSHAGVALAIITLLRPIKEESAQTIIAVVTTSIFVFEIIGPLSLRFALIKANEVDKSTLKKIDNKTGKIQVTLKEQWQNFIVNLGLKEEELHQDKKYIRNIMSSDFLTIKQQSNVKSVFNLINEHTQDCYPVIDDDGTYIGLIDMEALHSVIDDESQSLILAKSLIRSNACLYEDFCFDEAREMFKSTNFDFLPVINKDSKKLLGIVSLKNLILNHKKA